MPSRLVVRYAAAVMVLWVLVIVWKLPTLRAGRSGGTTGAAKGLPQPQEDDSQRLPEPPKLARDRPPASQHAGDDAHGVDHAADHGADHVQIDAGDETPAPPPPTKQAQGGLRTQGEARPAQPRATTADEKGRWPKHSDESTADRDRRDHVVAMIKHSWAGYKKYAWGYDEFAPISKRMTNWGRGRGIGATIVDALDTLLIAGLDEEADEALDWVEHTLSFEQNIKLSGFETTIRVLGGLLSTYQITGRPRVLEQAVDLGRRLARAFETGTGVPDNYVNLASGAHEGAHWNGGAAILSELGSLQMEHFTLSRVADDESFWKKARRAVEVIESACGSGYCPRQFHGTHAAGGQAGLGSFGDSFYEYLLKQWILSGKKDPLFKRMWDKAARHTLDTSSSPGGLFVPNGQETGGTMEHLACFSGGLFALSYMHTGDTAHLEAAKKIAATCHAMYHTSPSGLAPDVAHVGAGGGFHASEPKYILRPETVETYFYLYRATKDTKYRDWGWEIVEAIEKHLKIPSGGYAGAIDVNHLPVRHNDNMETFWFAETLKYMYLLFAPDDHLDLHQWVFNTEAHPMRVASD